MSTSNPSFFQRFDELYSSMTPKQKKIADYFREHYQKSVFFTLAVAAEKMNVSEASIIRFARFLGYDGYTAMQKDIQNYVSVSMQTTLERSIPTEKTDTGTSDLKIILQQNTNALHSLSGMIDVAKVKEFSLSLKNYRRIFLVGFESSACFAEYLGYYLSRNGLNIETVTEKTGDFFPIVQRADKYSLSILIMVARYPSTSIQFCHLCHARKAELAVISDTADHPLQGYEKYQFSVSHRRTYGQDLAIQIPMLTLLHLIIIQSWKNSSNRIKTTLSELEEYNSTFRLFT